MKKNIYYVLCSRYRLSEISFVLKAVATLVVSLKKAPANKGNKLKTKILKKNLFLISFLSKKKKNVLIDLKLKKYYFQLNDQSGNS